MSDLNNVLKQFRFIFNILGKETELREAPTGWREMNVEYSRSKQYSGLIRNVTGQLDFTGQAAMILRREYAKYRLFANVLFGVLEDTRNPYNTYASIYNGRLDFTQKVDKQGSFTVGAKTEDFTTNIDANDGTQYSIPLTDGINLEIPGLKLTETPQLLFATTPDFRSNAFFQVSIASYNQLSVAPSIQATGFLQTDTPVFDKTQNNFFFIARTDTKVTIQGGANTSIQSGTYEFNIYKSDGTLVKTLATTPAVTTTVEFTFNFNFNIDVVKDDRLFFYIKRIGGTLDSFKGVNIQNSQLFLSYSTITPPTMCQALTGQQLFSKLLQAMNVNFDNRPNSPVVNQSFLLNTSLAPLVFTSSDSIRQAQGSIYIAGDIIGPGIYKVLSGSVTYNSNTYVTGTQFSFVTGVLTFSGGGVVQKIQSVFAGYVYNPGSSLQAGGTYLVQGIAPAYVVYNGHSYQVGQTFKYILGVETYTVVNDPTGSIFVELISLEPQIIISLADFFQTIKSVQGGDAAMGVDRYIAINNTPAELTKQAQGIPYIETLGYVYRAGVSAGNLGNVPKDWQSNNANDMQFNKIKVGQNDQQYDAINGVQEVSSEQYYGTNLLNPNTELNLISPTRFDPYGAELIRVSQADSASSRSDNDTWGFWINQTPVQGEPFTYYRPLGAGGLISITGVDPSYYNWKLSPKHNLLRGSRYLASIFYGMQGQYIYLTGAKKNIGMVTIETDGTRTSESDPIAISSLKNPYFIPEYYSFNIPGDLIDSVPYGELSFNVNGNTWKGFVVDYKANLATKKPQQIKLLLSPNNILSNAVR